MNLNDFIEQTFGDYWERLKQAMDGLTTAELNWWPGQESNSIAFIAWHSARIEDGWTHRFAQGIDDVWVMNNWYQKFGLPQRDTGARYTLAQLANFPTLTMDDLRGYALDVQMATLDFVRTLSAEGFDVEPKRAPFAERIDDPSAFGYDFTVSRMYRQMFGELNQHLGQIRYLRGMQRGLDK